MLVRRVTIAGQTVFDRKKKLFVLACAKIVYHATLTDRGPWWTANGANMDVKCGGVRSVLIGRTRCDDKCGKHHFA